MSYFRATRRNPDRQHPRVGPEFQAELPRLMEYPRQLARDHWLGSPRSADEEDIVDGPSEAWTVDEREGFVLGLYIFKKNFELVKRFVGTKETGELLRFYYEKFYGGDDYKLWAKWRKSTGQSHRFPGKRLFTKWRGEMILSRLSSLVGEDLRAALIQIWTRFVNGRLSFSEYVFELKGIVGVPALVTAVGIGKGKDDLTQAERKLRKRVATPVSVNFTSLTLSEIFDVLNRHSELSKSEVRLLFSNSVWPRLQARGWHSERVEHHEVLGLKNSTVFLVNGKRKFSTRLEMGKHYFNSINAVLYEVASKPKILEDFSMVCAVVDTSLVDDEPEPEPARVFQLRDLPEDKASSQSGLTNEPFFTSLNSEDDMAISPVIEESKGTRKLFDLNIPYVPSDSEGDENTENDRLTRQENCRLEDDVEMSFDLKITCVPSDSGSDDSIAEKDTHVREENDNLELEGDVEMQVNDVARELFDLNVTYVPSDSGSDDDAEKESDLRRENENLVVESSRRQSVRSRATSKRVLESYEADFFSSKKRKK